MYTENEIKDHSRSHFNPTLPSARSTLELPLFNGTSPNCCELVVYMRKKQVVIADDQGFEVDLTLHDFPASLLTEFIENIVEPYFNGNLNAAVQDLMHKSIVDQEFVHSHITMVRNGGTP
jgi:hypothetical protein